MQFEIITLRLIHVLCATFWVGSGLFTTFLLMPALLSVPASMGPVMGALQQRRMLTILPTVALLTILSGARLMWITSAGFSAAYFRAPSGRAFAISAAAGVLAFLTGILVMRPAMQRAVQMSGALASATDDSTRSTLNANIARTRRVGALASRVVTILLIVAAAGMGVARYVG